MRSTTCPMHSAAAEAPAAVRKRRAIILEDEASTRDTLTRFFAARGYEVIPFASPLSFCTGGGDGRDFCRGEGVCSDLLLAGVPMRGASAVELFVRQSRNGCRLEPRNKAMMSRDGDVASWETALRLGCAHFAEPIRFAVFEEWVGTCEGRTDLSRPLATRRFEERLDLRRELTVSHPGSTDLFRCRFVNASPSGMCLRVPIRLRPGETLLVHDGHFLRCAEATVHWVRVDSDNLFLAGVHCPRPART